MSRPHADSVRVIKYSRPRRSAHFTSTTVNASLSVLSIPIRGGAGVIFGSRPAARRRSSRASTLSSPVNTVRSAASVRRQCAPDVTVSPAGSFTWNVSMAMPSPRVPIWAEMMFTPWAASVPAISAKSPGWSRVTTTRSDEPRSGWWKSSVTTGASSNLRSRRRCSAMRWAIVVDR